MEFEGMDCEQVANHSVGLFRADSLLCLRAPFQVFGRLASKNLAKPKFDLLKRL